MTSTGLFDDLAKLSGVTFVVSSMLAMGLSLTVAQVAAPLRNVRLVVLALVANFVLVPALAYGIAQLLSLDQSLENGLILLGAAAGAPFLPKLVQGARADIAFGVGLMVLLMVVTIAYVPLVLPLLLPGVSVIRTGGHSAGHQAVVVRGTGPGAKALAFFGDLCMRPWSANPRWVTAFDDFPLDSVAVKGELFRRAVEDDWIVALSHEVRSPVGRLTPDRDRFRFDPL